MTLKDLYNQIKSSLKEASIENESIEARRLICHAAGFEEDCFITSPDKIIETNVHKKIEKLLMRRVSGEPLSKIIGMQEFWGLPFKVTQDTLDPRSDTETLIERVLDFCHKGNLVDKPLKILDLGTGTGCILITLLTELPNAHGIAVDYSMNAAEIAQKNAIYNDVQNRMMVINSDWCEALDLSRFDIIVSNPPYIRDAVIPDLHDEVKNHDPILALSGGENGLDAYQKIIYSLKNEKKLRAQIFFEIGFDQLEEVVRLVDDSNLCVCDSKTDMGGNPRVVEICRGDK